VLDEMRPLTPLPSPALSLPQMLNVGANITRPEDVEAFLEYFAASKIGRNCIVPAYNLGTSTLRLPSL
jgi:hypothetical protein